MKRIASIAVAVLLPGIISLVYAGTGATMQPSETQNPQIIRRLLFKFEEARARAPFRYPTACVAGTAEEYTSMALRAGLNVDGVQLHLWTAPEHFGRVDHAEPSRKSGRCDYRVSLEGEPQDEHFIADFFSREHPLTNQIAYVKVWRQGDHKAILVSFPKGPRGFNPDVTFKAIPVSAQPAATP